MATLVIVEGPASGQQFALEQHLLVLIGRDAECTFQILDTQISRRHLQIRHEPGENRHYAVDFESSNGVCVNREKITGEKLLDDGDAIEIGETVLIYSVKDSPDAKRVMEVLRKHGESPISTQLHD